MEAIHWIAHVIALGIIGNLALALANRRAGHREQGLPIKRELEASKDKLRRIDWELSAAIDQMLAIRELTDAEMRP